MSLSANLEVTSPPQLELKMNKRKHAIKKYWEENREKILGIQKKHYQQNKEHIVEINKMHFIKVEKNELGKMENIPIIFKFKEGIHGGYVDECSSKSMKIYRIHALENGKEWIKCNLEQTDESKIDCLPTIDLDDLIWTYRAINKNLYLEDVMDLWIGLEKPGMNQIKCTGKEGRPHSKECDKDIHEALVDVYTLGIENRARDNEERFTQDFRTIREWILIHGGHIP